ncbi:15180_t:CDS:2, partial [Acaulospora colombiana]
DKDSGEFTIYKRFSARPILASVNVSTGAMLTGLDESLPNGGSVSVTSHIHDSTREDLVFVLYQGWLFSISAVATYMRQLQIFKQSIPHIAAALASECLATAWSMYKVVKIKSFQNEFNRVTINGVCAGVNVLPRYFEYRQAIEVSDSGNALFQVSTEFRQPSSR